MLGTFIDFLLVVLGFTSIVVIHEFGHFVAARWAGVRVLAFAVGFGPALVSFRKGMGLQRGSSAAEYARLSLEGRADGISPTEYRLNGLPFGGYVKMLGQEDLDPDASSDAPDSYQRCVPWKKMVIISAGVVFNLITAAIIFIAVFMIGLPTESARIGEVGRDTPAATTHATNARALGITQPGILPGDLVLSVNGRKAMSFNDVLLAGAMAKPRTAVEFVVKREGVPEPLRFQIVPAASPLTGLLEVGVGPAYSAEVVRVRGEAATARLRESFAAIGLPGLDPGMRLVRAGGRSDIVRGSELGDAARASGGAPFEVEFHGDNGARYVQTLTPSPEFETGAVARPDGSRVTLTHLLGLVPVMTVGEADEDSRGYDKGLRTGDIFVRIGAIEFPSVMQGMSEIRAAKGRDIAIGVLRNEDGAGWKEVELSVPVTSQGQIGFSVGDASRTMALLASSPAAFIGDDGKDVPNRAASLGISAGSTVLSVNGAPVANLEDLRSSLLAATRSGATVVLEVKGPTGIVRSVDWTLDDDQIRRLAGLSWLSPVGNDLFEREQVVLKADNPAGAVTMGLAETHRVMLTTYVTFARLFQGTVKIEHMKGPVGIAHVGTLLASKGLVWLLFFLALISVNLAVINFLPLPIVDGGQFLFILYERFRGRPPSIAFQNVVTIMGLILIGSVFLIVTYNDLRNLLGI